MLNKRVIPCLLLKGDGLVKTIHFKNPVYVGDPINAIRIFNEKEVDELIFLDITATKEGKKPNMNLISRFVDECFMPLSVGGGIRNLNDVREILKIGVEKVSINTYAMENTYFIKEISNNFGSQSIIVSIDVKKQRDGTYEVFTNCGTKASGLNPVSWAQKMEEMGAGEIFLNSIDMDGTMKGYDIELIKSVSEAVNIPVIVCGGAGKLQDFKDAIEIGQASAVAAGSFFIFHGERRAVLINYPSKEELKNIVGV